MTAENERAQWQVVRVWQYALAFLLTTAIIITRRPDAVIRPQFWSEDGRNFFADAYNMGWWSALFGVHVGYYHTVPRLGAALALLVPFQNAPMVLNLIAVFIQALPVIILVSPRSSVWGPLKFRLLMGAIFLALPNCWEVHANITNSQTFLALNAFLVLVAIPPRSYLGQAFDIAVLLLCGLTGPFSIFLIPIVGILLWTDRRQWRRIQSVVILIGSLVQIWSLSHGGLSTRPHYELGASVGLFARILAGQVYLGTLFGGLRQGPNVGPAFVIFFWLVAVLGTALLFFCILKSHLEMRLFVGFAGLLLAAPLVSPTLQSLNGVTAWETFATGAGNRYWFFPILAFGWAILWSAWFGKFAVRSISVVLLVFMCFASAVQWQYPAFPDEQFPVYAKGFEMARPGTVVTIPQCPAGWVLVLKKHERAQ